MSMLERHYDTLMRYIPPGTKMQVVDIGEPALRFLADDKQYWDYSEDFSCVMPPSLITWMEYKPPKSINLGGGQHKNLPDILTGIGCMFWAMEVGEGHEEDVIRNDILTKMVKEAAEETGVAFKVMSTSDDKRIKEALAAGYRAKWIINCRPYFEARGEIGDLYTFGAYLDAEGRIIPHLHRRLVTTPVVKQLGVKAMNLGSEMFPFFFAVDQMHNEDVSLMKMSVPRGILQKEKKSGHIFRYGVLRPHLRREEG